MQADTKKTFISNELLAVALGAVIALQGWLLLSVSDLKTDVAVLKARMDLKPALTMKGN